jgi:hypothetical protein
MGGMMPRTGIMLGHVSQRGVLSLDVDGAIVFFGRMRPTSGVATRVCAQAESAAAGSLPPVESFFNRQS